MQTELQETKPIAVLVVDDDPAIVRLIRHNLKDKGIQVLEATSGLDCMRILRETKVNLVLLDIKLPDFNGWGILSLLRLTEPLRHIPVVMVSVEPPDTALIKQFQPDDYIQKPFDIRELLARVGRVIGSRSSN